MVSILSFFKITSVFGPWFRLGDGINGEINIDHQDEKFWLFIIQLLFKMI